MVNQPSRLGLIRVPLWKGNKLGQKFYMIILSRDYKNTGDTINPTMNQKRLQDFSSDILEL